jgi:uncharacterized protein
MSVAENKKVVQSFYEAGNRGDLQACLDLMDEQVTWTNIGTTKFSGSFVGKSVVVEELLGPVFGQLQAGIRSTIHHMIAEDDYVAVQLTGQATTKGGRPYNNTYCHIFSLRDGIIREVTEYFDTQLAASTLTGDGR